MNDLAAAGNQGDQSYILFMNNARESVGWNKRGRPALLLHLIPSKQETGLLQEETQSSGSSILNDAAGAAAAAAQLENREVKKGCTYPVWWDIPLIPALRGQKQEDL